MNKIIVLGASGRMGRAVLRAALGEPDTSVVGAVASSQSQWLGSDVGRLALGKDIGVTVSDSIEAAINNAKTSNDAGDLVIIDFSTPKSSVAASAQAAKLSVPLVICTTGLNNAQQEEIARAGESIALVQAANTSIGVNVLVSLVEQAAAALGTAYDIDVIDVHHRQKVDAPSGTALLLGAAAARGAGIDDDNRGDQASFSRLDCVPAVRYTAQRSGQIVGEHQVKLTSGGEQITLSHTSFDRSLFAYGALVAARWVADKSAGCYTMSDVLNLKSGI